MARIINTPLDDANVTVEYPEGGSIIKKTVPAKNIGEGGGGGDENNVEIISCTPSYDDGKHIISITSTKSISEIRTLLNNGKVVVFQGERDYTSDYAGNSKITFVVYDIKQNEAGTYNIFGVGYDSKYDDGYEVYYICQRYLDGSAKTFTVVLQTHEFTWGRGAKLVSWDEDKEAYKYDNIKSACKEGRFPVLQNNAGYLYFGHEMNGDNYYAKFFNLLVFGDRISVQKYYTSGSGKFIKDDGGDIYYNKAFDAHSGNAHDFWDWCVAHKNCPLRARTSASSGGGNISYREYTLSEIQENDGNLMEFIFTRTDRYGKIWKLTIAKDFVYNESQVN